MYHLKKFRVVDGAMHPVKPGIMDNEHQRVGEDIINQAVLIDIIIKIGVIPEDDYYQYRHCGKDYDSDGRINNVSEIIS